MPSCFHNCLNDVEGVGTLRLLIHRESVKLHEGRVINMNPANSMTSREWSSSILGNVSAANMHSKWNYGENTTFYIPMLCQGWKSPVQARTIKFQTLSGVMSIIWCLCRSSLFCVSDRVNGCICVKKNRNPWFVLRVWMSLQVAKEATISMQNLLRGVYECNRMFGLVAAGNNHSFLRI